MSLLTSRRPGFPTMPATAEIRLPDPMQKATAGMKRGDQLVRLRLPLTLAFPCLALLPLAPAAAAVKPHALISDGMVLQRGMPVPVWGTAAENEQVAVRFQGQELATTTRNGKWLLRLRDLQPGGPFQMSIAG